MKKDTIQEVLDNVFNTDHFNMKILLTITSAIASWIAGIYGFFLESEFQFVSVTGAIFIDWVLGMWLALKRKEFQIDKASKVIGYLFIYNMLLGGILLVEKGFPVASFLSEAIMVPIVLLLVGSSLKKIHLIGYLPKSKLTEILQNIDVHKNKDLTHDKESI